MKEHYKHIIGISLLIITLFSLSVLNCLKPQAEFSNSERRKLKQRPGWSYEAFVKNSFGDAFEEYAMDQFPCRDVFRRIKAYTLYELFREKDNNGIYVTGGYGAKLNYPLKEASLENTLNKFGYIRDTYLAAGSHKIYTCIIPDKGYYLAEANGYPAMDYEKLFARVKSEMSYSDFIDIRTLLKLEDYYKTDTHWKQENIIQAAKKIAEAMGTEGSLSGRYEEITSDIPFYGVYYGQSALPLKSEKIKYLTNETINGCKVYHYETGDITGVYDLNRLGGRDPYEVFLSGAEPLLTIENPAVKEKKELIVFRDSFGSSLIPLLAEAYSKITVVDIRYIKSSLLGEYMEFQDQDVLFLYSTLLLNDSFSLK